MSTESIPKLVLPNALGVVYVKVKALLDTTESPVSSCRIEICQYLALVPRYIQ